MTKRMNSTGFRKKFDSVMLSPNKFSQILIKAKAATITAKGMDHETSITVYDYEGGNNTFIDLDDFSQSEPDYENIQNIRAHFKAFLFNKKTADLEEVNLIDVDIRFDSSYLGFEVTADVTKPSKDYYELLTTLESLRKGKNKTYNFIAGNVLVDVMLSLVATTLVTLIVGRVLIPANIEDQSQISLLLFLFLILFFISLIVVGWFSNKYKSVVMVEKPMKTSRILKEDAKYWLSWVLANVVTLISLIA